MFKKFHTTILFTLLALTLSTLACGASAPAQPVDEQPVQPAQATEPPVGNDANANATVSCAQLIPSDDVNLLLNNASSTLVENTYPGATSCEWKYTPNGGTQANLFFIKTDKDVSLWEATRNSELSNEPSDIVINSIDGLGDENYTWISQATGQRVVYVRKGDKTLVMRFKPEDILFLLTESGLIDYADRIFTRFE